VGRSTDEWIGKMPDTKVPPRVRLRIWDRHGGRCHITGLKIQTGQAWDCDHIIALCNGGEHRESNLAPALKEPHKAKTADDVKIKAKVDRIRKREAGIRKPRTITGWRRFNQAKVYAERER
jgi:5-methylcytosine-specific restriction protein A